MANLFYIMGASGCGKDSVIQALRSDPRLSMQVAHRYITRPADSGNENHIALTEEEFHHRVETGLFSMYWHANGLHYGVGKEVEHWLAQGENVLLNGSRAYYPQAKRHFSEKLIPIWITVDIPQLRTRLQDRGRETEAQINDRIKRAIHYQSSMPTDAWLINNSGKLAASVDVFIEKLSEESLQCN
ncbi:MAG: ribose 1,5-bisphosphokinase [Aliivibrio sp.]|uniref:ribose 1,5-bisphosphokinase n=1 Tax=Aliivibrio sp. TaxID=1872443 RepID=UPI001A42A9DD|nr:ribose 1,5-bisphosphokinase [Aliivibrio sp.]